MQGGRAQCERQIGSEEMVCDQDYKDKKVEIQSIIDDEQETNRETLSKRSHGKVVKNRSFEAWMKKKAKSWLIKNVYIKKLYLPHMKP
jgi:hypothetical protein